MMVFQQQQRRFSLFGAALSLLVLLSSYYCNALSLTVDNFDELTAGKVVFLKFFAPWCGHCRAMAGDWERLEEDWKDHEVALVAEVDCTSDGGQPLCEEGLFTVDGFPTLLWGDALAAEPYDGPRDYDSLAAFAKEHISKPICSVFHIDACDDDDATLIQSLQAKSEEELEEVVQKVTELVQLEETDFDEKVKKVQEQYDALVTDFNGKLDDVKTKYHYKWVEQIMAVRMTESVKERLDGMEDEQDL